MSLVVRTPLSLFVYYVILYSCFLLFFVLVYLPSDANNAIVSKDLPVAVSQDDVRLRFFRLLVSLQGEECELGGCEITFPVFV
jgi:hypothetical protein